MTRTDRVPTTDESTDRGLMTAVVRHEYGDPAEVLRTVQLPVPVPAPDELRIRVEASSVNPADRYYVLGTPMLIRPTVGVRRPREPRFGIDVAGVVEEVGADVTRFAPGDRVVGASFVGYAEHATVAEHRAAAIPDGVTSAQAAVLPVAGATAIQALRRGGVERGSRVLVNGASGGVGHIAVQLGGALGAEVTGVTSRRNVELVRSFGAHEVIAYDDATYTTLGRTWDVIIDLVGNHSGRANRDALVPGGRWVLLAGPMRNRVWGPVGYLLRSAATILFSDRRLVQFTAEENAEDLAALVGHVAAGTLTPHIERSVGLTELADAIAHLATGRTRGKMLVEVDR